MAGEAELDERIARIAAALDGAEAAMRMPRPDPAVEEALGEAQGDLAEARERIGALEDALAKAREVRKSGGDVDVEALREELAEMRAAREQDLAEMKSLLAELEPMLEVADA